MQHLTRSELKLILENNNIPMRKNASKEEMLKMITPYVTLSGQYYDFDNRDIVMNIIEHLHTDEDRYNFAHLSREVEDAVNFYFYMRFKEDFPNGYDPYFDYIEYNTYNAQIKPTTFNITRKNKKEIVKRMLKQGMDLGTKERLFDQAISIGDLELVKLLFEKDYVLHTKLYTAFERGYLDISDYLINQGADYNRVMLSRHRRGNILNQVGYRGNIDEIKYHLEKGMSLGENEFLKGIVTGKSINAIEFMINNNVNNAVLLQLIRYAILDDKYLVLEYLLDHVDNIDRDFLHNLLRQRYHSINLEIEEGSDMEKIIKLLLDRNLTTLPVDQETIKKIAQYTYPSFLKLFVENEGNKCIALEWALYGDNNANIYYLLSLNFDFLNCKETEYFKINLFTWAVKNAEIDLVLLLIDEGFDEEMGSYDYVEDVIYYAFVTGNEDLIDIIVNTFNDGMLRHMLNNILNRAFDRRDFKTMKLLIKYGTNVNYDNGRKLIFAILNNDEEMVDFLLDNGAKIENVTPKNVRRYYGTIFSNEESIIRKYVPNFPESAM